MRVLVPPPRESKYHEVASATDVGHAPRRREDTHATFTLPGPGGTWPILVLVVADGQGGSGPGRLASGVAVDAFGEALQRGIARVEFESWTWQTQVTDAVEYAFAHANAEVRALRTDDARVPATGLTAAVVLGDWLAVVHAGRGRAYRLRRDALEQLTSERSAPPVLGAQAQVLAETRFVRLQAGDVIAVCSDGLYRYIDGDELARWLSGRDGLMEILVDLLTATADRGGDEDTSICLCRVRRLPEETLPAPAPRADKAVVVPDLPLFKLPPAPRLRPTRLLFAVATVAVGIGALGGSLGWWSPPTPPRQVDEGWVTGPRAAAPAPAPAVVPEPVREESVVPPPMATASDSGTTAVVAGPPARENREPAQAAVPDSAAIMAARDSVRAARREARRVRDSVEEAQAAETAQRLADEQRRRDSARADLALRRARDSAAAAANAMNDAEQQRLAQERADATRRAAEMAEAEMRSRRVTAGRAVLNSWLQGVATAAPAGDRSALAIATGPPSFANFVAANQPRVDGARITGMTVDEMTGQATAEWTLRWRTEFGTTTQRRVRASADAVRDGDTWRIRTWRILEGAP